MIYILFITFLSSLYAATPLKINIYTHFNGIGLETDAQILSEAIGQLGHEAYRYSWFDQEPHPADINIYIERIMPERFEEAKLNWFISNPEWYQQENELLSTVDLILCRTAQSLHIFKNFNTYYLGFTSPDAYRPKIPKDYTRCVHLPGSSHIQKGTKEIIEVWQTYSSLPHLTIVSWLGEQAQSAPNLFFIAERLAEKDFRYTQNHFGIHLCPSSAEGFGHYIMEAMSTEAVVLTTNGSPMNELIKDPRCLIGWRKSAPYRLGVSYTIMKSEIHQKVNFLLHLPTAELINIGKANRKEYLRRRQEFFNRLELLLTQTSEQLYTQN